MYHSQLISQPEKSHVFLLLNIQLNLSETLQSIENKSYLQLSFSQIFVLPWGGERNNKLLNLNFVFRNSEI